MVKKISLVMASLVLSACVAEDPNGSSSSSVSSQMAISSDAPPSSSSLAVVQGSSLVASSSSMVMVSSAASSESSVMQSSSAASLPSGDFDFAKGKLLYEANCLECHGIQGTGTAKRPFPIAQVDYSGIMSRADAGGNMPDGKGPLTGNEYKPEHCVGDCAHQVAGYITAGFPGATDVAAAEELGFDGCSSAEGAPGKRAIRLLTRHEYQNTVNDIFGLDLNLTTNFPPESREHGFTNNADLAFVTARHLDEYYSAASRVAAEVQNNLNSGVIGDELNCGANYHCLRTFVEKFGQKIFRRPLDGQEIDDYLAFFTVLQPADQNEGFFNHSDRFKEAVAVGLPALLMSPHFLYRKELGQLSGGVYQLNDYEMATLIAYTFTGSTPDNELLGAARNQQVRTKQQFKAQAERLLATEKGKDQMARFAIEWWDAGTELIGAKNNNIYTGYSPEVSEAMVGEMEAFFKHVTFDSSGKFQELYTADYTMLNDTLARFYGIGSGLNTGFAKVSNDQRGGILMLGGILASNASTEETSPVKRGVFVREQLMCDPLPPFPRDVAIPNPDLDPSKPMRQRFEEHSVNPDCQSCHKYFDDIGFTLENFDASGKYRDREKMYDWATFDILDELDILTQGKVINVDGGEDEHYFTDRWEFSQMMANANSTKSCMTTQYYRYVAGYTLEDADNCAIENLNKTFAESEFDIQSLLIGITQLDSFSVRK